VANKIKFDKFPTVGGESLPKDNMRSQQNITLNPQGQQLKIFLEEYFSVPKDFTIDDREFNIVIKNKQSGDIFYYRFTVDDGVITTSIGLETATRVSREVVEMESGINDLKQKLDNNSFKVHNITIKERKEREEREEDMNEDELFDLEHQEEINERRRLEKEEEGKKDIEWDRKKNPEIAGFLEKLGITLQGNLSHSTITVSDTRYKENPIEYKINAADRILEVFVRIGDKIKSRVYSDQDHPSFAAVLSQIIKEGSIIKHPPKIMIAKHNSHTMSEQANPPRGILKGSFDARPLDGRKASFNKDVSISDGSKGDVKEKDGKPGEYQNTGGGRWKGGR